ncbi:MAG TPA: c-type cytochrome, partial [Phycisphaerae bacterium]
IGKRGQLDFALVDRHTRLSELIRAPRYPFAIDHALAERGERHYQARCASCHDPASEDHRLHALDEIGTDPNRAKLFDARQAELYNAFFAGLEVAGYKPPGEPAVRSTQKYWAPDLAGVWARAPYLHNGSVRTVRDLLTAPPSRPRVFHRGTAHYDTDALGFADEGPYVLDTMTEGNSCAGHDYGTDLTDDEKRELIEYLKTR